MAESNRSFNDQSLVRSIRRAVERFNSATEDEDKLRAIMAVSALAAVGLVSNSQMRVSTISFIEGRLR